MFRLIKPLYTKLANNPRWLVAAVIIDWVICSWSYSLLEDHGPIEGLWWGVVTGSTVGYGDFYPETTAGRFVGTVLIVSMVFLLVPCIIAQIIMNTMHDPDDWTDEEQRALSCKTDKILMAVTVLMEDSSPAKQQRLARMFEQLEDKHGVRDADNRKETDGTDTPATE